MQRKRDGTLSRVDGSVGGEPLPRGCLEPGAAVVAAMRSRWGVAREDGGVVRRGGAGAGGVGEEPFPFSVSVMARCLIECRLRSLTKRVG